MNLIINNSSMQPIYEQIISQIKALILNGTLPPESILPSVRGLSRELQISALTVKKAYDCLEEEGFLVTVHGKGSFVAAANTNLLQEKQKKDVEADLEAAICSGRRCGLSDDELRELFELILEEL